jgi:predicted transcriptional regulator
MVAARVSPAERAAVERLAQANDRTASREVRRAIRFYLAHAREAEQFLRARTGEPLGRGGDP